MMNFKYKYFSKNKEIDQKDMIYLIHNSQNAKLASVDESLIVSTSSALICYVEGKPIGICGIRKRFLLCDIYMFVNEKYTNLGLGSKILEKFINKSQKKNISLYLLTRIEKEYLVPFNLYVKNDFEPLFVLNKKIFLAHKSLLMSKKFKFTIYFIFIEIVKILKLKSFYKRFF